MSGSVNPTADMFWQPSFNSDGSCPSRMSAITEAVGSASVCWDKEGVFLSEQAINIARGLDFFLDDIAEPLLGLATTAQLIDELRARAEINGYLNYRTVD